jgi:hypothetical protein
MAAIAIGSVAAAAAPLAGDSMRNASPLTQLAQYDFPPWGAWGTYGYGFGYRPACPVSYVYSCWADPYGYRHCGCVPERHW